MSSKKKAMSKMGKKSNHDKKLPLRTSVFDRLNYFLVLAVIFVVPLIFDSFTFDPFDLIKNVTFRIIVSLMAVFLALDFATGKKKEIFFHPGTWFFLAFVIWAGYSALDSVVFWTSFWGKYRRFEGFVAFLFYLIFLVIAVDVFARDKRRIETAIKVAFFAASLISLYGIIQYLGYDFMKWGTLPFEARRSFSTLGNPALLAGYLVTVFPLALAYSIFTRKTSSFVYGMITTILTFTCLITAFNRTSWLAAALSIVCFVVIVYFLWQKRASGFWVLKNTGIVIASIALIFVLLAVHSQLEKTPLTVIKRIEQMTEVGGSFAHRLEIWKAGLRMIAKEPFNGLGPDTFRATSRMFQGERYGHIAADIVADNAHNYEIHIASGTGIVGFMFFAAFIILVFLEGLKILFNQSFSASGEAHFTSSAELASLAANVGLFISFLAYLFQMITSVSIIGSTIMWWFAFAAILSQSNLLKSYRVSLSDSLKFLLLSLSAIFALLTIIFNVRLVIADYYYLKAKAMTGTIMVIDIQEEYVKTAMRYNPWQWDIPAEMARSYFFAYRLTNDKKYLESALHYALLAENLDNYEADIKALLTQIYTEMAAYEKEAIVEAETVALKMTEMMPHHYVSWQLLGQVYFIEGEYERAIEALEESTRNNPFSAESYYLLSQCYNRLGNKVKSSEYLEKAREINPEIGK